MEKYLRMSDVFGGSVEIRSGNSRHVMCAGVLAANCFCADSAEYAAHAINSHDELVEMNKELLAAIECLLDDMRFRAKMRGDVEEDGCVILDCGSGVLMKVDSAIAKAKAAS